MLFLLVNYSPIYSLLWMVTGVIGFFLNKKIKNEMMNCLKNYQLFHLFEAKLFALFTSFLFGPFNYYNKSYPKIIDKRNLIRNWILKVLFVMYQIFQLRE